MSTTVNIHDAKTQLSRLIAQAERGEEVVIARAGKPIVRLTPLTRPSRKTWLGCLKDYDFRIPDDFNEMGREEIEKAIYGDE